MNTAPAADRTKGECDPEKVPQNWRISRNLVYAIREEAVRLGFGKRGSATFINNLLTRYFNGETIKRDQ